MIVNRYYRLTNSSDIQRVRRIGKSVAHPLLVLLFEETSSPDPARTAIITGKAIGCAVIRNRTRRVLKEVMRSQVGAIRTGVRIVVIARKDIANASFHGISEVIKSVLMRAGLVEVENVR